MHSPERLPQAAERASREDSGDLNAGRRVLDMEAAGLTALSRALDGRFVQAVDLLAAVAGRVIVTGMGKSGHVARKIAATLAGTGTPAFFVHPGEASHGDLGMIAPSDVVLALSNSGKTSELTDIIVYTRRFRIPLICVTGRADSLLAEQADLTLLLPAAQEACPLGLAPTTSTTMMLALGDAIAVAVLNRKGFSEQEFQMLHPGGALGKRLLRVIDIMHSGRELPLCAPGSPMGEAVRAMTKGGLGCVGVCGTDGRLVGIITDGDLRRNLAEGLLHRTAGEIMSGEPKTIRAQALAAEAMGLMNSRAITCLFVMEDDRPIGLLHMHDCLRAAIT